MQGEVCKGECMVSGDEVGAWGVIHSTWVVGVCKVEGGHDVIDASCAVMSHECEIGFLRVSLWNY